MRIERDSLGSLRLPDDVYYGIQTKRAMDNFPISGLKLPREFIRAQGIVKLAAVRTNRRLGLIDERLFKAIERACIEVIDGRHDKDFVVDVYQAGAGTSQNMNANEVIANRAIELLGGKKGDYSLVHPNDHVNMAQSTNDTIPTSIYISATDSVSDRLMPALIGLRDVLGQKSKGFRRIVKAGRTHLQDAVPMTLGQEFSGYASSVRNDITRLRNALRSIMYLPIGGNATGTGINAHPKFRGLVIKEINSITGRRFKACLNPFEGIQNMYPALELSSSLRSIAVTLTKMANDIRLLSSGPMTGLSEITLPAVQPGSSIMPGKVNPVMAEMLNMVCFQIMGNDLAISYAIQASQLELNVMMPLIAYNLLFSIEILTNGINAFNERCLKGIKANAERCKEFADATVAIATALNPVIGYSAAAEIAKEAVASGKTIKDLVIEKGILSRDKAENILNPERLALGK